MAKELGKKYTELFGKQGAKNARHKVGKQLGKSTKAAAHNLSISKNMLQLEQPLLPLAK